MQRLDLEKIDKEISTFVNERDWDQFHSVKNLSMALTAEASELMEIFQWLKEEESNQIQQDMKKMLEVKDEVADIFIYLLRIVKKTGINIEEAILEKIKKNSLKYPVELAKGNSKKYTDLN
ncbi:MAG: nucleotide pyrophosphohydrolase [Bacteriovoracaceae bacterium]|nr:nucleotide pyrophosphohydrolase [Bacteriovoracaceae bacterium]